MLRKSLFLGATVLAVLACKPRQEGTSSSLREIYTNQNTYFKAADGNILRFNCETTEVVSVANAEQSCKVETGRTKIETFKTEVNDLRGTTKVSALEAELKALDASLTAMQAERTKAESKTPQNPKAIANYNDNIEKYAERKRAKEVELQAAKGGSENLQQSVATFLSDLSDGILNPEKVPTEAQAKTPINNNGFHISVVENLMNGRHDDRRLAQSTNGICLQDKSGTKITCWQALGSFNDPIKKFDYLGSFSSMSPKWHTGTAESVCYIDQRQDRRLTCLERPASDGEPEVLDFAQLGGGLKQIAGECVIAADDTVKCWGYNSKGQLGFGEMYGYKHGIKSVLDSGDTLELQDGVESYCKLNRAGALSCWGGISNLPLTEAINGYSPRPIQITQFDKDVRTFDMSEWAYHICAIMKNGDVRCAGNHRGGNHDALGFVKANYEKIEGLDKDADGNPFKPVQVAAGSHHTCVLSDLGSVKCWGFGKQNELGDGKFVKDATYFLEKDKAGSYTPPVDVTGLDAPALEIATFSGATCALLKTDKLVCWGDRFASPKMTTLN